MLEPELGGIEPQALGDLVDVHLEREARLRRAVAALGPAGRFVGERPSALELVARHVIGDGLERARVVGARHPVGAISAAVEQRAEVHRGDRAVLGHAGSHPHERGMTAAVAVEDLFAGEGDLHRPPCDHRELRRHDLVAERIALAAEPAPVGAGDDADARRCQFEHLRERPVDVMRRLGRAPQRELGVRRPVGDRGVLLHRQMRAALEEERVFLNQIGGGEARVHVAELEVDELVEIPGIAVVVDAGLGVRDGVEGVGEGAERLVPDDDAIERGGGDFLRGGRHRGDRVAHESRLVERQRVLVLTHGEDPERDRQIPAGEHRLHARQRERAARVDRNDPGVGVGAAQQLGVQHARQRQVVRELGGAGHLGRGVHLAERLPHDLQGVWCGRARRGAPPGVSAAHTAPPHSGAHPRRAAVPPRARPPRRS